MSNLRDRIAKTIWKQFQNTPPIEATDDEWESWWDSEDEPGQRFYRDMADAVIAELTKYIPPIVASAIHSYADAELSALHYHGGSKDAFEAMEKLNGHAANIANYATTHEKWNGKAKDE